MKKIGIFILLVCMIYSAYAVSTDKMILALDCEGSTNDSLHLHNGIDNIISYVPSPYGGQACSFDGTSDSIQFGDDDDFSFGNAGGLKTPAPTRMGIGSESAGASKDSAPYQSPVVLVKRIRFCVGLGVPGRQQPFCPCSSVGRAPAL